ncbi:MAG: leucine-rich repeat domain-containing protein [Romboutsia sp.]
MSISEEKKFIPIDNPCDSALPKVTVEYLGNKKYVCAIVYFNASLLNDFNLQDENSSIEVYDFAQSNFVIQSFEYCSSNVPNPTIYDFLTHIKSTTTLVPSTELGDNFNYYLYSINLVGKIYLAPLVEITQDTYTLAQLNQFLGKASTNTQFSRGELASINKLEYINIPHLNLYLDNFKYFLNLTDLIIQNCDYNNLPDEICSLSNLESLNLSQNFIQGDLDNIVKLNKLKVLNLSFNHLEVIPYNLANLNSLEILYLNNNDIYDLSLFKNTNVEVYANEQLISRTATNIGTPPSKRYELNIEFLRDIDDTIPPITSISNGGNIEIINGEHYIVWINPFKPIYFDVYFSSSSSSHIFNGWIHVQAIG